ncbi:MAG: hypothetical protein C0483_00535 [Pirellula sp.]|nr:hypothetical protein [Pirellula sp.]
MNYVLLILFISIVATLLRDGLWSNTITLFSTVTAAVVATNYFEPVADLLTGFVPAMLHFWDLLALGLVFTVTYVLLRTIGTKLSRFRVRFHPPVDNFGGVLMAAFIGWTAVMFVCFALHLAPLSRNFMGGSFDPEQNMLYGLAPDRKWLGFMQKLSNGGAWGRNVSGDSDTAATTFDPKSEFMLKYASRRAWLDTKLDTFVN